MNNRHSLRNTGESDVNLLKQKYVPLNTLYLGHIHTASPSGTLAYIKKAERVGEIRGRDCVYIREYLTKQFFYLYPPYNYSVIAGSRKSAIVSGCFVLHSSADNAMHALRNECRACEHFNMFFCPRR